MNNDTTKVHLCSHHDVQVDSSIARFVQALNDAGIHTGSSCCGHGERDGAVLTQSEGEYRLVIIVDAETSQERFRKDFQDMHSYWEEAHK